MYRKIPNTDKMFTFMRGFCSGGDYPETQQALTYMRQRHEGQTRKDGEPYIVHPLSMACFAIGLGVRDDKLLAVILLHDVCEDTGVEAKDLPCSEEVKRGVDYMTIKPFPGEDKKVTKERYYRELLREIRSLLCKGFDRYNNLGTIEDLSEAAIVKNIRETHELLLPRLREAKDLYPEYANLLYVLRQVIQTLNDSLAKAHGVELYQEEPSS